MFLCTFIMGLLENVRLTIDFAGQHCLAARAPWLTPRRWRVYGNPFHPLENKMLEVQFCFVFIRSFFLLSVNYLRIFLSQKNLRLCRLQVINRS